MKPKPIIAAVLFAAAGLIFYLNSGSAEELPDETPNFTTPHKCVDCDKRIDLDDPEFFVMLEAAGGDYPLICSGCSEKGVYRYFECSMCQTGFFGVEAPGGTGRCPKCFPEIAPEDAPVVERQKRERVRSF